MEEEVRKDISLPNTPFPRDNSNPLITISIKFTNNELQQLLYEPSHNNYSTTFGTFDALFSASESNSFGSNGGGGGGVTTKKISRESTRDADDENILVQRRYKRMIKNRESAARSRARKQAYITELELEVAHLADENARLRKQQQKLLEAPSTQLPKNHGLHRTSSALF